MTRHDGTTTTPHAVPPQLVQVSDLEVFAGIITPWLRALVAGRSPVEITIAEMLLFDLQNQIDRIAQAQKKAGAAAGPVPHKPTAAEVLALFQGASSELTHVEAIQQRLDGIRQLLAPGDGSPPARFGAATLFNEIAAESLTARQALTAVPARGQ